MFGCGGSGQDATARATPTPTAPAPTATASPEATAAAPRPGLRLRRVGTFDSPVHVTSPPGDRRRLFVVEQGGRVRVMRDGRILSRPFLDLRGRISAGGERGSKADHGMDVAVAANGRDQELSHRESI